MVAGDAPAGAGAVDEQPQACPVDHKTREIWLAQARAAQGGELQAAAGFQHPISSPSSPATTTPLPQPPSSSPSSSSGWGSWRIPFWSSPTAPASAPPHPNQANCHGQYQLGNNRVISSIPRTADPGPSACPANAEQETGSDARSGNWIYPSERMFFEAMRRKGRGAGAHEADMRTVVPIHNAVNERAWAEIRAWEAPYAGEGKACDGPRLHSFEGLSTKLSPKARLNTLLGYTAPFDRHDWVVDRCGKRVEYIIDFYAGRPSALGPVGSSASTSSSSPSQQQQQQHLAAPPLSFYLDVRPKLNSWEGVKMRALRGIGLA